MAEPAPKTVDAYLSAQPPEARAVLSRVCAVIREALPTATEHIRYRIPTFEVGGRAVVYLAGWKTHISLYPATPLVVSALGAALAPFVAEKGTLRIPLGAPLPLALVKQVAALRLREVEALVSTKASAAKKPVAKKPVAKKSAAKKPVAKKPAAKKPVAKRSAAKKPAAKKPAAKEPVAKKSTAKRGPR